MSLRGHALLPINGDQNIKVISFVPFLIPRLSKFYIEFNLWTIRKRISCAVWLKFPKGLRCGLKRNVSDRSEVFHDLDTYEFLVTGVSANAVPYTKKLRTRVINICDYRKRQPNRSAMEGPRPGRTSLMIKVSPVPGKYDLYTFKFDYKIRFNYYKIGFL